MNLRLTFPAFGILALISGASEIRAGDWSHIMGPRFDRKTAETPAWTTGNPRQLWEISAEGGFSSFVTGDGKAFTVIPVQGRETATALDRKTGKTLWQTPLGAASDYGRGGDRGVDGNDGGDGPRATPVFAENRVFVYGSKFDLYALESSSGKILWTKDLIKEHGAKSIQWANAASPLVIGDRVLVAAGGNDQTYLAFKVDTGELLWKSGSDRVTHSTPILATIHHQKQALFMVDRGLVSIDPANGRELWHYPFPHRTSTAASPVVWNDIVNCSAGYGVGGGAVRVTRQGETWEVAELWRSPGNKDTAAHWMTAVAHEGYLYGCYGHGEYGGAAFKCIDIRTGKVMWQQRGFGHGQVIMAGNRLLVTSDSGKLALIEPDPKAYRELATTKAISGKVWASPAFSDGEILLRSTTSGVALKL